MPIVHKWSRYDEKTGSWPVSHRIRFPIAGGRSSGYRGYSFTTNTATGRYRVDVETERGQIIGRIVFSVVATGTPPVLVEAIR